MSSPSEMAAVDAEPVVQAPQTVREDWPSALLVLLPGGLLFPKDYAALIKAVSEQQAGINLWVASPPINWQRVMGMGWDKMDEWTVESDAQIEKAVQAASDAGFPLQGNLAGPSASAPARPNAPPATTRLENVFVAMHSAAATFYGSMPMKRCAGAVMLAAMLDGSVCTSADVVTATRPIMHIFGQLDGQLRLPRVGWGIATAAPLATQFGLRHLAQTRPFAIIPNCNHAQFSNGVVNVARGDLPADGPLEAKAEAVAGLIANFVAANHPETALDASSQAIDQLMKETKASFELLTPFAEAAGRGSPAALLAQDSPAADTASHARGTERLSMLSNMQGSLMHPGEVAAAERFARSVQQRLLAVGMPDGAEMSVRVAVTVHPKLETFIYTQPTVFKSGDEWVVHCHVRPYWEYYQDGPQNAAKTMSPIYWMKLKKGSALALAIGLQGSSDAVVSAAEVNEASLEQAEAEAPPLFLETYRKRGKQLQFAPDRDMTANIKTPIEWMDTPLAFDPVPNADGTLALTAPFISTPTGGPMSPRMAGNHYIKCCSPAWMHEWIMVESLRH